MFRTSHTASASWQIVERFTDRLSEFVLRTTQGEPPLYPVNKIGKAFAEAGKDDPEKRRREMEQAATMAGIDKAAIAKFFRKGWDPKKPRK